MKEASEERVEKIASRRLCREDQTAQDSAADAQNIAHSRRLCREDQTFQHLAANANTSPTAGAPAEMIRLPSARQQQSTNQAKYWKHFQLQIRQ
jgi:hypothetical protein